MQEDVDVLQKFASLKKSVPTHSRKLRIQLGRDFRTLEISLMLSWLDVVSTVRSARV